MSTKLQAIHRFNAKLPYRLVRDGDWWIAACDLFKISNQGKTKAAAERNLKHAITLKFKTEVELGTLNRTLESCGFHRVIIGDKSVWAASAKEYGDHRLSVRTKFVVETMKINETQPEEESVPNILPWIIDWYSQSGPSRRGASRVA